MFATKLFLEEKFKSPSALVSFLSAYDCQTPNISAVEKWFQRGAVPGFWFPLLVGYLELDEGRPVSIVRYFKKG